MNDSSGNTIVQRKRFVVFAVTTLFVFFTLGCFLIHDQGEPFTSQNERQWKLVWSDEFNSDSLDMSHWSFDEGGNGWGNNELQYYTKGPNIKVSGGRLVIEARKEPFGKNQFTSARIKTQGKASWTYGRIEAKIKLPYGKGIWPAFWMLGENITSVGYPECGEIDIMEMVGSTKGTENATIWGSLHRPHRGKSDSGKLKTQTASYKNIQRDWFNDDYHIFGIKWTADQIQYYVDNRVYKKINFPIGGEDGYDVFSKPFFIILNLAVGGDWPGAPDTTTDWPKQMEVDWVRVYQ